MNFPALQSWRLSLWNDDYKLIHSSFLFHNCRVGLDISTFFSFSFFWLWTHRIESWLSTKPCLTSTIRSCAKLWKLECSLSPKVPSPVVLRQQIRSCDKLRDCLNAYGRATARSLTRFLAPAEPMGNQNGTVHDSRCGMRVRSPLKSYPQWYYGWKDSWSTFWKTKEERGPK